MRCDCDSGIGKRSCTYPGTDRRRFQQFFGELLRNRSVAYASGSCETSLSRCENGTSRDMEAPHGVKSSFHAFAETAIPSLNESQEVEFAKAESHFEFHRIRIEGVSRIQGIQVADGRIFRNTQRLPSPIISQVDGSGTGATGTSLNTCGPTYVG